MAIIVKSLKPLAQILNHKIYELQHRFLLQVGVLLKIVIVAIRHIVWIKSLLMSSSKKFIQERNQRQRLIQALVTKVVVVVSVF